MNKKEKSQAIVFSVLSENKIIHVMFLGQTGMMMTAPFPSVLPRRLVSGRIQIVIYNNTHNCACRGLARFCILSQTWRWGELEQEQSDERGAFFCLRFHLARPLDNFEPQQSRSASKKFERNAMRTHVTGRDKIDFGEQKKKSFDHNLVAFMKHNFIRRSKQKHKKVWGGYWNEQVGDRRRQIKTWRWK